MNRSHLVNQPHLMHRPHLVNRPHLMNRPHLFLAFLLMLSSLPAFSEPVAATEPTFLNAEVHALTPPLHLERAFSELLEREAGPAWLSYTVPMVAGGRILCCGGSPVCKLERRSHSYIERDDDASGQDLRVLLRIRDRRVSEIRALSSDCRLDAGGLPVYVWESMEPRQSLDFLIQRAQAGPKDAAEGALFAIAHHGDREADQILERIARGEQIPRLEEEAVFWLGEARGVKGFEVLERLRHELRDTDVLEKIAFALHLNDAPGALPALIEMAREAPSSDVRESAIFWLSQEASEQATAALVEASEEDPDLDVKEHAIFAISQLPPDRGVPLLIRYARTHESHQIRKKAMFWLGQTDDPRALEFFEEILLR